LQGLDGRGPCLVGDRLQGTGYTTDLQRRVREHDEGNGAKYTRGRTPVELVHAESFDSKSAAMSREHEIKSLSRAAKEQLVGEESAGSPRSTDDAP
jgi:putative endonuclease